MNQKTTSLFSILFVILSIGILKAQTLSTIISGPENKLEMNERTLKVLGTDGDGLYVLSSSRSLTGGMMEKFKIQKYDVANFTKKWAKDFSLNISSEPFEAAYLVKGKVLVFYSTWEKTDKTKTLNIKTISSTGEIKDDPNKEVRIKSGMFDFAKRDFYFAFSPDSSKILVVNKFQDKKKPEEVTAVLLDAISFKKIWEKTIPNKFNNASVLSYFYRTDNAGNLYYLLSYLTSDIVNNVFCKTKAADAEPTSMPLQLESGRITNSNLFSRLKDFNYDNAGIRFIESANEISYELTSEGQLYIGGIFKDFKQRKAGMFQYLIDAETMKTLNKKEEFFDASIENSFSSFGKVKTSFGCDYAIHKIEQVKGTFFVFADAFKLVGFNPDNTVLSDTYGQLLFTSKQGELGWSMFLPGKSRNVGTEQNTLQVYSGNGKLNLCYGIPDPKTISGSSLAPLQAKFEAAKNAKNDITFLSISEKGIDDVFGYSTPNKKESIYLLDNFITLNGSFLLPFIDFNNMTGKSNYIKFVLVGLK